MEVRFCAANSEVHATEQFVHECAAGAAGVNCSHADKAWREGIIHY